MRYIPLFAGIALAAFSIFSLVQLQDLEPREITIDDVIAGKFEDGDYVRVTGCWALYDGIYEYSKKDSDDSGEDHDASTSISCFYYPVFSSGNAICRDGSLEKSHEIDEPEDYEKFIKNIRTLRVVVKTRRFKKLGDIPGRCKKDSKITGQIKNGVVSSQFNVEREFDMYYSNAGIADGKLIQIDEGRIPGEGLRIGGIAFGITLLVVGVILIAKLRSRDKAAEALAEARSRGYGQTYQQYSGGQQQPGAPQPPQDDGFPEMPSE